MLAFFIQPTYGQVKSPGPEGNEINTPKKRLKSRKKGQIETKVKVKRKRNYIEKKSKNNSFKANVSQKSNETVVPIEDSKAFSRKTKKPLRKLKNAQKHSEKVADSEGKVRVKKAGSDKEDVSDEKVTQRIRAKSLRRQRKEEQSKAKTIAASEGKVRVKRAGSHKEDVSDEKVTQRIKTKSQGRQKRAKENQAERVAGSDGPIEVKRESYRKRPGTIYSEDKKGGSRYKSQSEKGAYTHTSLSAEKKEKRLSKRSQARANYQGDVKLAKGEKDMHPSASYLEGKKKKSFADKEKLRKKELKKSRTRNGGQPKVFTEKRKKPKYDTRESEIWNE